MSKGKRRRKATKNYNKEIQVVILIVISIILAVLIYSKSAYIGENLSPFLGRNNRLDKIYSTIWYTCNGNTNSS